MCGYFAHSYRFGLQNPYHNPNPVPYFSNISGAYQATQRSYQTAIQFIIAIHSSASFGFPYPNYGSLLLR
jgi:hypothetical protein